MMSLGPWDVIWSDNIFNKTQNNITILYDIMDGSLEWII